MKIQTRKLHSQDKPQVEKIFSLYWNDPEFLEELSDEVDLYLSNHSDQSDESNQSNSHFIVAEKGGEVIGIVGCKKIPEYLKEFSKTENPVELYVIASKNKREGIGTELKSKIIEKAREEGFSEMLLFSPETHKESWSFHDTFNFERAGEVTPPEDEIGCVWRKVL